MDMQGFTPKEMEEKLVIELAHHLTGMPKNELKKSFDEFKKEQKDNNDYNYTIYDVFHKLDSGQKAIGKNTRIEIRKTACGDFIDQNDEPLLMTADIISDVYCIVKIEDIKKVNPLEAINAYYEGHTIAIQHNGRTYVFHGSELPIDGSPLVTFDMIKNGVWLIKGGTDLGKGH